MYGRRPPSGPAHLGRVATEAPLPCLLGVKGGIGQLRQPRQLWISKRKFETCRATSVQCHLRKSPLG
jgi:hypothetical protein